jgi:hypothetical protein
LVIDSSPTGPTIFKERRRASGRSRNFVAIIAADNFSKQSVSTLRISPVQLAVSARKSAYNSPFIFPMSQIILTVNVPD